MTWTRYDNLWVLYAQEKILAVVFPLSGHVERPDAWYAKVGQMEEPVAFADIEEAKQWVMEELKSR